MCTQYTVYQYKKRKSFKTVGSLQLWDFFPRIQGLKNEFETAVVNESSVFEPLKVYCM